MGIVDYLNSSGSLDGKREKRSKISEEVSNAKVFGIRKVSVPPVTHTEIIEFDWRFDSCGPV